jgi:hypothetical protein
MKFFLFTDDACTRYSPSQPKQLPNISGLT